MIDIKYPVYEVVTPQTNFTFKIRTLTLNDEMKLRTSILANKKSILQDFNKLLWSLLEEKPEEIKDYNTFTKSITVTDRKALVLGTYHISYGDEFSVSSSCPVCGSNNLNSINLIKHSTVNAYTGKPAEILLNPVKVDLPVSKFIVHILPPVLDKEIKANSLALEDKIAELTMIVDSLIVDKTVFTYPKNINDIAATLKILPTRDTKAIQKSYLDNFGKYDVSVRFKVICSKCQNEYEAEADFMEQLFRMVLQ